jgi:hypothetical protein
MNKPAAYIETSVISYLTGRTSSDLLVAAHQKATQDWWIERSHEFDLFISEFVIDEAEDGHPEAASKRLAALTGIPILETLEAVELLAVDLIKSQAVPMKARLDALHIAMATIHKVDYLLTWNFKHIANAEKWASIQAVCQNHGFQMPYICSPLELMKSVQGE